MIGSSDTQLLSDTFTNLQWCRCCQYMLYVYHYQGIPCDDLAVGPEDPVLEPRRAEGEPGDEQLVPSGPNQGQLKLKKSGFSSFSTIYLVLQNPKSMSRARQSCC